MKNIECDSLILKTETFRQGGPFQKWKENTWCFNLLEPSDLLPPTKSHISKYIYQPYDSFVKGFDPNIQISISIWLSIYISIIWLSYQRFWPKYQLVVPKSCNLLKSTWLVERLHRCPPRLPPRVREHPRPSLYQPLQPPPTPHSLTYILWVVTMCFTPKQLATNICWQKSTSDPLYINPPTPTHPTFSYMTQWQFVSPKKLKKKILVEQNIGQK